MKFSRPFALTLVFLFAVASHADWKLPSLGKKPKRIETLIVTGNYVASRVLAELIQKRIQQPILLLPTGSEDDRCYYIPPTAQSLEVEDRHFLDFVKFLRPKKVLYLGNEYYAPADYHDKLVAAEIPTWAINNEDWGQIAESAEDLLKIKHLHLDYLVLIKQVDEDGRIVSPGNHTVFGEYVVGDQRDGHEWIQRKRKLDAAAAAAAQAKVEAEERRQAELRARQQQAQAALPLTSATQVAPAQPRGRISYAGPRPNQRNQSRHSRMFWDDK